MTSRAFPILALVLLAVGGCSSAAQVVSQWRDPEYTAPPDVKRIMVVGVSKQAGIRRKFEDVFVERLKEERRESAPSRAISTFPRTDRFRRIACRTPSVRPTPTQPS